MYPGRVTMKVQFLYFDGCPNHEPAYERLRQVIREEGISVEVEQVEISNEAAADKFGFLGSPTIRVNGVDIEPASREMQGAKLACRRYSGGGMPSAELIQAALREAQCQAE